ncbi:MAG: PQQ-binding-like beta-propeller repeat protein [Planctomycetota bacterium]
MHLAALLPLLTALSASNGPANEGAGDWPQFLGPDRDSVAPWPNETFTWPEDGPSVAWRVEVGPGFGGVAVADGEVFLLDRMRDEGDVLRVFDLGSGEELWAAGYPFEGRLNYDGSRTVPSIVGRRVYTASGFGPVSCFDRDTQDMVWQVDLEKELGGDSPMFGWSTHPIVVDDLVLAAPLGPDTGLVALDRGTGEVRWKTAKVGFSHSTPIVATIRGEKQILFNACPDSGSAKKKPVPAYLWSINPTDGSVRWRHDVDLASIPIPPPVVIDDERILLTGGYRAGSTLLNLDFDDSGEATFSEAWRITRGAQIHPPIVYRDHAYVIVNENWTNSRRNRDEGGLMCIGLDGKERWRTGDDPNFGRGGIVRVADALLLQDGFMGTLVAVRATSDAYEELGRFDAFDISGRDGQLWAPLAVSGTRVVLRSQEELVCVELAPTDQQR